MAWRFDWWCFLRTAFQSLLWFQRFVLWFFFAYFWFFTLKSYFLLFTLGLLKLFRHTWSFFFIHILQSDPSFFRSWESFNQPNLLLPLFLLRLSKIKDALNLFSLNFFRDLIHVLTANLIEVLHVLQENCWHTFVLRFLRFEVEKCVDTKFVP